MNGIALQLPAELQAEVDRTLADWDQGNLAAGLKHLAEAVDKAV